MEHEALAETGNIVLNGCLATMANMLQKPLTMSLPEVLRGERRRLFFDLADAGRRRGVVLFLYINFAVSGRDIRGYIAMLMDLPSAGRPESADREFIAARHVGRSRRPGKRSHFGDEQELIGPTKESGQRQGDIDCVGIEAPSPDGVGAVLTTSPRSAGRSAAFPSRPGDRDRRSSPDRSIPGLRRCRLRRLTGYSRRRSLGSQLSLPAGP